MICCVRYGLRQSRGGSRVIEMRRTQISFGDGLITEEVSDLRESWMIHADAVLADEDIVAAVYEALAKRHPKSRCRGRRGAPAEMVLRLLVLKHIRNWSYEVLEREVRANLVYRDFTHVGGGKTTTDAGGQDGGGDRHPSSDRQYFTGGRGSGADAHHAQDHHDGGHGWNQTARSDPECEAASTGDRTGGARQRPDQPGQIGATLSPIVGYDEPGGRTGEALLRGDCSGNEGLCECIEATHVGR